ncbi:MAG TPA: DUF3300 domain-containing protein [Terriglobales bacterium]|jgi:hypothetical protein|nr:DUF3300 domain-containing protein [Terriglobales bacterium]
MNNLESDTVFSWRGLGKQTLACILSLALLLAAGPVSLLAQDGPQDQDAQAAPPPDGQGPPPGTQAPTYVPETPDQLQRLVAPIALYPDSLVAQILAASTFPDEIVEADRWVQANPDLKGQALGDAVNQQPWDPSVKALTAFPSVLGNMDKNLSWTSTLGDAYYNQQQSVMDAVQVMRRKAQDAGALKTTQQEVVKDDGPDIEVEPADPNVVYVPAYDPWLVYGYPIVAWPGWYPYPGIWFGGPYLSFGLGFGIGWWGGFGWGWGHWGFDWHNRYAVFDHGRYFSRSRTFYNRGNYARGGGGRGFEGARGGGARGFEGARGGGEFHGGAAPRPFEGDRQAARGYAAPRGESGVHSGAFSGYDHGGESRSYSSRGQASVGGGGFHGGGGGGHAGGGGHGGGGRH